MRLQPKFMNSSIMNMKVRCQRMYKAKGGHFEEGGKALRVAIGRPQRQRSRKWRARSRVRKCSPPRASTSHVVQGHGAYVLASLRYASRIRRVPTRASAEADWRCHDSKGVAAVPPMEQARVASLRGLRCPEFP